MARRIDLRDDRFRIDVLIGEGSSSRVFRARDQRTGQLVAVKVLRDVLLSCPESIDRFLSEIELLEGLEHPNIPPVVGKGESRSGAPWFAYPYAARGSLADRMLRTGKLDPIETAGHAGEVLDALHYLHGRGIIHRDVKPENVLIDDQEVAMLCDFGIALAPTGKTPIDLRGTPAFLPPEQYVDPTSVGPQTDLFGLGVTLFVALTGQSGMALWVAYLRPGALAALPAWLSPVVDRATRPIASERYASAWEMALALGDALERAS